MHDHLLHQTPYHYVILLLYLLKSYLYISILFVSSQSSPSSYLDFVIENDEVIENESTILPSMTERLNDEIQHVLFFKYGMLI